MDDVQKIAAQCTNILPGHGPQRSMKEIFQDLAGSLAGDELADRYGEGDFLAGFEAQIAALFGKEAAVFMPSGTMAQQIALRIWCERQANFTVAMHPTAHPETSEHAGYQFLHGLRRLQFGGPEFLRDRILTAADFDLLGQKPGVALLELPYRPLGGQLPTWDELLAIKAWTAERGIPFHLDGARIWQCTSFYQKSYQEIGALFDSVYVSFYKDIGALCGAMLLGTAEFIAEARVWQRRHGGNLFTQAPFVVSAKAGIERVLPQIEQWVNRAKDIAAVFNEFEAITIRPYPPQVNFFQIFIRGDHEALTAKHHALAQETGTFLFSKLGPSPVPGVATTELHCWENAFDFDLEQLPAFLARLL